MNCLLIHQSFIHQTVLSFRGPCNQRLALIAPVTETPPESTRHHPASQPAQPASQPSQPSPARRAQPSQPSPASHPSPAQPAIPAQLSQPLCFGAARIIRGPDQLGCRKGTKLVSKGPKCIWGGGAHQSPARPYTPDFLYTRLFSDHHGLGIIKKSGV